MWLDFQERKLLSLVNEEAVLDNDPDKYNSTSDLFHIPYQNHIMQ